jgi:protein phosphatase-4 regulatory subunit 3
MFDFFCFHPQEDEKFLTELFAQLTDGKSEEIRRKELVLFLKEFCTFAQALQPPGRESFFKTLNNLGILQALEITLQVAVSFQLLLVLIIFFIITVLF